MKIFALSTFVGLIGGILGWAGAGILESAMGVSNLASIPWGSTGLMVGSVALIALVLLATMDDLVDPIMMFAGAASGVALMWDRPFEVVSGGPQNVTASYWVALGVLFGAFVLLTFGLRDARMTAQRYRK